MTKKSDLQKELLEKVKPGVKASDIKKLRRSKSADDITQIPTPPPPPNHLLTDQLKEKQKELEKLRKEKDDQAQAITELKKQLDNSLEARTNSLKDWQKQQEQIKSLNQELNETIDQASQELTAGDDEVSNLRQKVYALKAAKESLERELKLARINRRTHSINDSTNSYETKLDYFQYSLYALMALWFISVLNNSWNNKNHA